MMTEIAEVVSVSGRRVTVSTQLKSGCGSCAQQSHCGAGVISKVFANRRANFEVQTDVAVTPGQQVELLIPDQVITRFSLLMYALPILVLTLVASLLQSLSTAPEGLIILLSFASMMLSFYGIKQYLKNRDMRLQQRVSIRLL